MRDRSLGRDRDVDYVGCWVDPDAGKFFCLVKAPTRPDADAVHAEGHGMLPAQVYRVREGMRERLDNRAMSILCAGALSPDANCVDVGCNRGAILRQMVRCAPEGRHIAFEPIPELCELVASEFPGVDVRQVALSSQPGESKFVHVKERPGYSHLLRESERVVDSSSELISVPVDTLDHALPDGYVPSLLKIDVEGAQLDVLKGAVEVLSAFRPIVLFEHGLGRHQDSEELFELLSTRARLRLYDIDGNGPLGRKRFRDVVAQGDIWNFVARP